MSKRTSTTSTDRATMTFDDMLAKFADPQEDRDGYLVHCPAHDDSQQSLRLTVSDKGKVLLKCRAGCETKAVVKAMGMTLRELASMDPGDVSLERRATSQDTPAGPADIAALAVKLDSYASALLDEDHLDAPAAAIYASRRFGVTEADIKRLRLGYAEGLGGGPRLVVPFMDKQGVARGFQARALADDAAVRWLGPKSPEGASWARVGYFPGSAGFDEVVITEGPGDALTSSCALGFDTIGIRGAGLAANTSVIEDVVAMIAGRPAIIAGDGDPSGRRFSAQLAEALVAHDVPVKILDMPEGQDLSDWRKGNPPKFYAQALRAIAEAEPIKSRASALLAWDEARYSLTDLGGARYLRDYIESIGSGVKYTEEAGFFILEDGIWRQDNMRKIRTLAQAVADIMRTIASNVAETASLDGALASDKDRAKRFTRYSAYIQSTRGLDSILSELKAVHGVPVSFEKFDQHHDLLACRNGVVNLRTGELQPHKASLLISKVVDLDYDPSAKAPRWEQFLDEVFPTHPALAAYMSRLVGYSITGHTTEQCFAVLYGKGSNGKSIFTDTLTSVFREHATTTPFSTFEAKASGGIPNDLAALKGARQVFAPEGDQGKPMAEALLKRITGRDMISARFMRKEFFEFQPTFLIYMSTNHKPNFRGQDDGLWRRVKLIPWVRHFAPAERDHHLGDKLAKEAPGILAWAVRGAVEWYKGGLQDPAVIMSETKEYRATSDALAGFMPGIWTRDNVAGRVEGGVLFDSYLEWADAENLPQREIWTRRTFFGALEERGLTKRRTERGVAFEGVRRARQTDNVPDHADSEAPPKPGRAGAPGVALSKTDKTKPAPPITGAGLDDI